LDRLVALLLEPETRALIAQAAAMLRKARRQGP
jgi:hypothetical protein